MRLPLSGQGKGALDVIELSLEGSLLPIIPYPLCIKCKSMKIIQKYMSMQCKQGSGFPTSKKVCKCSKCELKHLPLHYNFCIEIWLQAIHVYKSKTLKARRTRQSKQCEFCIYLDKSLGYSEWFDWSRGSWGSRWSRLPGVPDGQGGQGGSGWSEGQVFRRSGGQVV